MNVFLKTVAALGIAFSVAHAHAEFVSISGNKVNIRASASTKSDITWELTDGYPMQVMQKRGNWLKVKDFEGELGWVYRPLTGKKAHHIVKSETANMRSGPGTQNRKVGRLQKYDLVQTLEKKNGWVKGRASDGKTGWISKKLLWGW
ncbi:SH3 domain-containing protein [Comamonas sp. NoAH]|uniref:SH3 domain-containing protein n=1 Tax=Comamonas halotolerans TaxID=3041496 RepID=UPI0024E15FD1|nr:SH3 domain-containing protein [Comamonas sp. NoAH]